MKNTQNITTADMNWLQYLEESYDASRRFKDFKKQAGKEVAEGLFWDVPISADYDYCAMALESAKSGPLAGITTYVSPYQIEEVQTFYAGGYDAIPVPLKNSTQWIWMSMSNGRCEPYLCRGVAPHEYLHEKNHVGFCPPVSLLDEDVCGIAYVCTNEVLEDNLIPVVFHIQSNSGMNDVAVNRFWIALGCPYMEYAKNNNGWIIIGYVDKPLPTFNSQGIKIFTSDDSIELSGLGARGCLKDITARVLALNAYSSPLQAPKPFIHVQFRPETPQQIIRLKEMLSFISADCHYHTYRAVVWAILSTGWSCAEQLALEWSLTAKKRFEQKSFDNLVRSYDPLRANGVSLGTIHFLARNGGWNG